jgi:hypothetical protein
LHRSGQMHCDFEELRPEAIDGKPGMTIAVWRPIDADTFAIIATRSPNNTSRLVDQVSKSVTYTCTKSGNLKLKLPSADWWAHEALEDANQRKEDCRTR